MDPRKLFVDERLRGFCSYCDDLPDTRDHVPSRVFLDEPFPANLPVVEACRSCNESFSQDEEYIACFIECVLRGTTEPLQIQREKIKKILIERPLLAARIQESCSRNEMGNMVWKVEMERVENVILKLARGHLAFELNVFILNLQIFAKSFQ
jgi:hypothetical protein